MAQITTDPSQMVLTPENVEIMISYFYKSSDPTEHSKAHALLSQAQASPVAWNFVWDLLQFEKPFEVHFYAASTLHLKLLKYWAEVPREQQPVLREKVMSTILAFSSGHKIVLSRLCIVMATVALQMIPDNWPNAIEEIMEHFTHQTQIPPERSLWILLETLKVVAEESNSNSFPGSHRSAIRSKFNQTTPQVLELLERTIPLEPAPPSTNMDNVCQAIKCCSAWLQLGVPLSMCKGLSTRLIQSVHTSAQGLDNFVMGENAADALSNLLCRPNSHKFPSNVMEVVRETLSLLDVVENQIASSDPDEGVVSTIFTLLVSIAESHSHLLLQSLLLPEDAPARLTAMRLIQGILQCSNMPGQYPVDESCSQMAFGFWYMLQDDIIASEPAQYQQLVQLLLPMYAALAEVLLHKSMLPTRVDLVKNWSSEDRESFRCYRQDVADTLLYCYSIMHESLLQLLWDKLDAALAGLRTDISSWRQLETVLHGFLAIAEVVPMEEERFLPRFLSGLKDLPLNQLDVRVAGTVLDAVGAYAEWINQHPDALGHVMPLLIMGLNCTEVATPATMALKDLTRDRQPTLRPYCMPILMAAKEVLASGHLRMNESVRMMYVVGRVLSVCPLPHIFAYLDEVLLPRVTELQELTQQNPDPSNKANILLRLKMVSTLFLTLDTKPPNDEDDLVQSMQKTSEQSEGAGARGQAPGAGDASEVQPVQIVLRWLLPVLHDVAEKWASDEHVMEALSSSLKNASATLLDDCKPLLPEMVSLLARAFALNPQAPLVDTVKLLLVMFGRDSETGGLMQSLLREVIRNVLHSCQTTQNLSDRSDLIQAFFNMLHKVHKKDPTFIVTACAESVHGMFQLGIASLGLPEAASAKAAVTFLSNIILCSRESPHLQQIVSECGHELTFRTLRCIGSETPRSSLDPLADILMSLNKKYCEDLSRWLPSLLAQDGFPTHRPTKEQKDQFARSVIREPANKRKLQELVREFALVCRGLMNEYGEQQSPFF